MADAVNVQTTRLYRVTRTVPMEVVKGDVLWLVGSRKSCLGGYVGNFQHTYQRDGNTGIYSPNGKPAKNVPMHFVEPIPVD